MLPTAIDIFVAFLIAQLVARWWMKLGSALLAGSIVAITYHLALGLIDYVPPGVMLTRMFGGIVTHAVFTALCVWGFSGLIAPARESDRASSDPSQDHATRR